MNRGSVAIGGGRLTYWRTDRPAPDGPTILLIHGLAADHEGLLPLAAGWPDADVIAPDLPGFGKSEPLAGTHSLQAYARTLDAMCTELELSDVTVVGHSLGATIALVLAAEYPQRFTEVALLSPVTTGSGPQTWLIRAYYALGAVLPPAAARLWFLSRFSVYLSDRSTLTTHDRRLRRRIMRSDYRTAALASPRAIIEIYRSIRATSFDTLAERIRASTMIVGAERDALAPPSALARLQARVSRSHVRIIGGAGHLWAVEEPTEAARLISAFLQAAVPRPLAG